MQMPRRNLLTLILGFTLTAVPAIAQQVIATIPVGTGPIGSAVDSGANHIYVLNQTAGTLSDIDGATNLVAHTVTVGSNPSGGDINPVTRKGYIANTGTAQSPGNSVTVINLVTYNTSNVTVGYAPSSTAVNSVTNRIYVTDECGTDPTCSFQNNGTVSVIDGATNSVIATITAGNDPRFVAVNPATNKIYVSNRNTDNVTVIDGATNTVIKTITLGSGTHPNVIAINTLTNKLYVNNQAVNSVAVVNGANDSLITTLTVGNRPAASSINAVTNKIYVVNQDDNTVSVIDGVSDSVVRTVTVGTTPASVGVDTPTNKVYVSNSGGNTVTMIDGATYATTTVNVGTAPLGLNVNPVTNRAYVSNYGSNNVSVIAGASAVPAQFVAVTPCRLYDTRPQYGGSGPISGGTSETFNLPQLAQSKGCADLSTAVAYSLNVAVVPYPYPHGSLSYLTMWPTGEVQPLVATLNSLDGRIKANAAILPAGYQGAINVYVTNTTDVILDIDGYVAPVSGSTLACYPLTPPCRVADTRNSTVPQGLGPPHLSGGAERDFPVLSSTCGIPGTAQGYSLNLTAVPYPPGSGSPLGYLEVWPKDHMPQHPVSTLNNLTGTIVANAALVPAGTDGKMTVYPSNDTDLVIDANGYFAPAGPGGMSLYPAAPCRVIDTRKIGSGQPFSGTLSPPVDVVDSQCGPPSTATAYVFNATVVPTGGLGYLTLWPDPLGRPTVATLNAIDGWITNNIAIVPNINGKTDAYASGITQLILDISSYFAP
jgi:YVTN family beta-propeller protein